jgi:hypothetical protein
MGEKMSGFLQGGVAIRVGVRVELKNRQDLFPSKRLARG